MDTNSEDEVKKAAKCVSPDYQHFFLIDIDRNPNDPLFYGAREKKIWLTDPVIQGHVVTLVRIAREIAVEDLKLQPSDFKTDIYADGTKGSFQLRIRVEKSVLRQCYVEIIPPALHNIVHAIIHYHSPDKVVVNNQIEDFGLLKEKAADTVRRHTFPRNQAVAILYLVMHQPVAKAVRVWYRLALVQLREAMLHKRPKHVDFVVDVDDPGTGLELRDMRHSKSEAPVVSGSTEDYEHYDEALRLAHSIMSEPIIRPLLLGVAYGKAFIMLDFGFVYVTIKPTSQAPYRFKVCMGKYAKCGDLDTGDIQRVQELLLDTTKLTMREMRLKYDEYYQRLSAEAKANANKAKPLTSTTSHMD